MIREQAPVKITIPCEHAVKNLFPSIRASIARILVEEHKLSRYEAAKVLGISPAAITYYLEGKRGDKLVSRLIRDPEISIIVRKAAKTLLELYNRASTKKSTIEYQLALCSVCSRINEIAVQNGCPAILLGVV
ncbi:MAG: transcriptional regulator [Desulfurococcales archaeon]|nr:transcriptional regulator [Desulfurococcales archaeon]